LNFLVGTKKMAQKTGRIFKSSQPDHAGSDADHGEKEASGFLGL
jgi:hypothetical protein